MLYGEAAPEDLVNMFHPDQLEQRFGGAQPTPTNFWPPYVGKVCRNAGDEHLP